ncbi:AMP-binding protein [Desulfovibrio sp.]|uniref:phenylacetate--CoA ligase family protein n=1 Tax=Desulfovibrio sp. TaxID=885 RepID=UPI0025C10C0A|nr:AMP-binding protein [Desulfovibrio sp.]
MSARRDFSGAHGGKKTALGRAVGGRNPVDAWLAGLCGAQENDAAAFMTALAQARTEALARTLNYAAARSSFYARCLAGHDLGAYRPENMRGLPFTTAEDLARWQDFLCVSQGAVRRMVTLHTSGTTGQPKRLAFTDADLARTQDFFRAGMSQLVGAGQTLAVLLPGAERPNGVADLLRQSLHSCGVQVCCPPSHLLATAEPAAEMAAHTPEYGEISGESAQGEELAGADGTGQNMGKYAQPHAAGMPGICSPAAAPASVFAARGIRAELAHWLAETGAHCLVAAPGQLEGLLRYFPSSGPPGLCSLLSSADRLDPVLRHVLASVWNCTVLDHYGLTEMGYGGAVECPAHDGYHLRALDMIVEIVDFCGDEPLPHGEAGEVVITTLEREAMPLIRYRTGDVASLLPGPCGCGSPLPRLGPVRGRLERCGGRVRVMRLQKGGRKPASGPGRQPDTADAPHCLLGDWA